MITSATAMSYLLKIIAVGRLGGQVDHRISRGWIFVSLVIGVISITCHVEKGKFRTRWNGELSHRTAREYVTRIYRPGATGTFSHEEYLRVNELSGHGLSNPTKELNGINVFKVFSIPIVSFDDQVTSGYIDFRVKQPDITIATRGSLFSQNVTRDRRSCYKGTSTRQVVICNYIGRMELGVTSICDSDEPIKQAIRSSGQIHGKSDIGEAFITSAWRTRGSLNCAYTFSSKENDLRISRNSY